MHFFRPNLETLSQQLLVAAFVAVFGALIVQFATKFSSHFKPRYDAAWSASFLGYLAAIVMQLLLAFVEDQPVVFLSGNILGNWYLIPFFIATFLIQAAIYLRVLRPKGNGQWGYGNVCLVSAAHLVFLVLVLF